MKADQFARKKFVEGGLLHDRVLLKPNFVDPAPKIGDGNGGYALFVGRLPAEKGIRTLLSAWERIGARLPLQLVGDGAR